MQETLSQTSKRELFQGLKLRMMATLVLSLLGAHGAFAQKVTVEFDQAADFSKYKTFAIRDGQLNSRNPALNSDLVKKRIDAGIDTGDILMQRELPIAADDTAETLGPKLAIIGAGLMVETLRGLESAQIRSTPQDHAKASLAPILTKEDGRIDFQRTATEIFNRLRGFQPWPGGHTLFRERQLQVHRAHPVDQSVRLAPGQISVESTRLLAGCGSATTLEVIELQLEGKRRMSARDFINGYQPQPGEKLGQ